MNSQTKIGMQSIAKAIQSIVVMSRICLPRHQVYYNGYYILSIAIKVVMKAKNGFGRFKLFGKFIGCKNQ